MSGHRLAHCWYVWKLLALPPHPPNKNFSHRCVAALYAQRGKLARHMPGSIGISHTFTTNFYLEIKLN